MELSLTSYLELLDWRRQVAELYDELRHRPLQAKTLAWVRARAGNHVSVSVCAGERMYVG